MNKKSNIILLAIAFILTLTFLVSPNTDNNICSDFLISCSVKMKQVVVYRGIEITPLKVLSDSRCPVDVVCIWTGEITISVRLSYGINSKEVIMKSNQGLEFAGKTVTIINVTPLPHTKKVILDNDYNFRFSIN